LIILIIVLSAINGHTQMIDTDFSKEGWQRARLRKEQNQEKYGYQYNTFEQEKQLIFRQLEVITGDEETRYIIVPGDTLTVSFNDRGERTGSVYKVSSKGEIHMPLIGAVKISGVNRMQTRALLNERLGYFIRHPEIDISVNTSGRIMLLGEVLAPGLYLMQPNFTVMEAILQASGYNVETANLKSVVLIRGGGDASSVIRLDLLKMIKKGDRSDDVLVKPGDMIFIPRRFILDLNRFLDRVYDWVNTYYGYGRLPAPPGEIENQPILWK